MERGAVARRVTRMFAATGLFAAVGIGIAAGAVVLTGVAFDAFLTAILFFAVPLVLLGVFVDMMRRDLRIPRIAGGSGAAVALVTAVLALETRPIETASLGMGIVAGAGAVTWTAAMAGLSAYRREWRRSVGIAVVLVVVMGALGAVAFSQSGGYRCSLATPYAAQSDLTGECAVFSEYCGTDTHPWYFERGCDTASLQELCQRRQGDRLRAFDVCPVRGE